MLIVISLGIIFWVGSIYICAYLVFNMKREIKDNEIND